MCQQPNITVEMRATLVDWLVEVHVSCVVADDGFVPPPALNLAIPQPVPGELGSVPRDSLPGREAD